MKTQLVSTSNDRASAINAAVELLRKGEVVALPTETVYGLAADALNSIAVAKVFEAKDRPRFDPLIVHLPNPDWLDKVADLSKSDRQLIVKLAKTFWPGPFTMVVPKRDLVPEIVTAGLDTVAVRVSANPVFAEIVRTLGAPLAAPSANRFGRISPTTAQHVFDELSGRVPLIIDGGPTAHGIESTIAAVHDGKIRVMRRGPITSEQLSGFGDVEIATSGEKISAPGQLPSHYAPRTPLRLIDGVETFAAPPNKRVALLAWSASNEYGSGFSAANRDTKAPPASKNSLKFVVVRYLSEKRDLREAAANLFRYLRELDELGVDLIVAERVPDQGLGSAILDRLTRASYASDRTSDRPR